MVGKVNDHRLDLHNVKEEHLPYRPSHIRHPKNMSELKQEDPEFHLNVVQV